jgi:hypothetical protein
MSTIRPIERQFSSGIDVVVRDFRPEGLLPAWTNVGPADIPSQPQLDQLFRLRDMNDVILDVLQPEISSFDMLNPARFLAALNAAPRELRGIAQTSPHAARALGRAAYLVSDEISHRNLARWFLAALPRV